MPVLTKTVTKLLVRRSRGEVHARADARFEDMVDADALAEAAAVGGLDLDPALPAMRALGVAPLIAAARGQIALEEAVAQAKAETRKYIKRQETWFRKYMISWNISSAQ